MRKSILALAALALLIGTFGAAATAAAPAGGEPPRFDPATVVSLQAQVLEIRHDATDGRHDLHLVAVVGERRYDVHVGPQWFVDDAQWAFAVGDSLLLTGSEVQRDGEAALIAVTIERGEQALQLRDDNGLPLWAGGRRSTDEAAPGRMAMGGQGCGMAMRGQGMGGMRHGAQGSPGQGNGMGMMCMRHGQQAQPRTEVQQGEAQRDEAAAAAPQAMCPCSCARATQQQEEQR